MKDVKENKSPIVEAVGGIHIGKTFIKSFQASWPIGKIEIYQDFIILRVQYLPKFILKIFELFSKLPLMFATYKKIPKKIKIYNNNIKEIKKKKSILGYSITILHTDNSQAPFLQFWLTKDSYKTIINCINNIKAQKNQS